MAAAALTDFEFMTLLAILRLGDDAYGVPIMRAIEDAGRPGVMRAAVYAALDRLQRKGLVRSRTGDPTPERGGRAKRYFQLTAKGLTATRDMHRTLTALSAGLPALKGASA